MRLLTLRERDAVAIGTADGLTETEVAALARLQPSLPSGALAWEHRAIRFGPFCGVLHAGGVMVELLPKVDDGHDPDDTARGLLVAMLRATGTLAVAKAGEAALGQQRMHLLDHFILDFCSKVSSALRGGAIASYREQSENLHALRGRLRLTEHVRRNAFNKSALFCDFDERTIDNPHNRALKGVLRALLPRAIGAHAKAAVAALLHRFDELAEVAVSARGIECLPFDRITGRWEPVFERAGWLLRGLFPDVRAGDVDGTCLLFNMERLFEAFIGTRLRQAWHDPAAGAFRVELQGPQECLAHSNLGPAFTLRPDISILRDGRVVKILDAKWKKLDRAKPNSGVSSPDAYQLASYASRYGCRQVALIYPASRARPPGQVDRFTLNVPGEPILEIHSVDLRALAFGAKLSPELLPPEQCGPAPQASGATTYSA